MKFGIIKFISLFLSSNFFCPKTCKIAENIVSLQSGRSEPFTWPKNKNRDYGARR